MAALFIPFPDEIKMKHLKQENLRVDYDQNINGSLLDKLIWVDPSDNQADCKKVLPKYNDKNIYIRAARIIANDQEDIIIIKIIISG